MALTVGVWLKKQCLYHCFVRKGSVLNMPQWVNIWVGYTLRVYVLEHIVNYFQFFFIGKKSKLINLSARKLSNLICKIHFLNIFVPHVFVACFVILNSQFLKQFCLKFLLLGAFFFFF